GSPPPNCAPCGTAEPRRKSGRRNRSSSESPVAFDTLRIPAVAYADVKDRMPSVQEKPVVRIAPNNHVFDLPVIVGIEERLFEAAGLDVAFSATYADREKDQAERPIMSRLKEHLFESGSAD